MQETTTEYPQTTDPLTVILLVLDKEKMNIQAVKGVDKNGNLQTVDPTKKNQGDFLRIDKNGDLFSNFFSNFLRQLKNPTQFTFSGRW
ncbi:hypothetical protein LWM68_15035 [Niabella sp. W65]|nr:hypothetical protein [Niabella sp. W65]MCH7363958.1 hypothetical protein [Niabella sp. W65]ULT39849.1 hypothetical protein KRR40_33835 [Niabella sp. I65]